MDTPTDYLALSFEEQDAILAMISVAAHDCARAYTRYVLRRHDPMLASDIAQDVVLFCLVRLRAGQWSALREARVLPLVQAIVARRGVDLVRQRDRRSKRERIYMNALACAESAWMSPDVVLREKELEELVSKTLDSLGPAYRRAFEIVRNEELTYEETARRLGLSPSTVSCYMTRALRRFREMLIRDGIEPPLPLCTTPKSNDGGRGR